MAPSPPPPGPPTWFLPAFLVVWLVTMAYLGVYVVMIARVRWLNGEAKEPDDWVGVVFQQPRRSYVRWIFSGAHRALGDAQVSRLVPIVRGLFVAAGLGMLTLAAAFVGGR